MVRLSTSSEGRKVKKSERIEQLEVELADLCESQRRTQGKRSGIIAAGIDSLIKSTGKECVLIGSDGRLIPVFVTQADQWRDEFGPWSVTATIVPVDKLIGES